MAILKLLSNKSFLNLTGQNRIEKHKYELCDIKMIDVDSFWFLIVFPQLKLHYKKLSRNVNAVYDKLI